MNVKELIEKIGNLDKLYGETFYVALDDVLDLVKQLDEQKPVKVPQFVAEIIEYYKGQNATLYDELREKKFNKQYNEWLMNEQDAYNKVARAWLDGYEVEKEKRYYVRFKWIEEAYSYLTFIKRFDAWTLADIKLDKKFRSEHTRKELEEAGFGWVFNCEGIEIEEVEG